MGRLENTNALPLGVALQALALFVAAFFMGPGSATSPEVTGVGSSAANTPGALTSLTELPRDLKREMLPVPRVPKRENRNEPPQPTPADDGTDSLMSEGTKLASLRTASVSLSGLVAIPISAPMLGVPDSLDGLSLARGSVAEAIRRDAVARVAVAARPTWEASAAEWVAAVAAAVADIARHRAGSAVVVAVAAAAGLSAPAQDAPVVAAVALPGHPAAVVGGPGGSQGRRGRSRQGRKEIV